MLVLTRRVGEEIVIDGNIHIKVLIAKGDRVRLGISAPKSVRVDRQEVHERRCEFEPEPKVAFDHLARTAGKSHSTKRKLSAIASSFTEPFDRLLSVEHVAP